METHKAKSDCHPQMVIQQVVLAQQYHINKGLKKFGERGREAVRKEMNNLMI